MISNGETTNSLKQLLQEHGFIAFTEMQRVSPNEMVGTFDLPNDVRCQILDVGVLLFEANECIVEDNSVVKSSADIVLSCGIHGNETGPIEMLAEIIEELVLGELFLANRLLCILGNPLAVALQQRFSEENLNRLFNIGHEHEHRLTYEAKRAEVLEQYVDEFFTQPNTASTRRIHYDLHTAIRRSKYSQFVVYPYSGDISGGTDFDLSKLAFFAMCGINTVLLSHQPSNTFSYFSSHCYQAESFTVELGQVKPFGENNADDVKKIRQGLSCLIAAGTCQFDAFNNDDFTVFSVKHELLKQSDQFLLHVDPDVHNFHRFPKGYQLTSDKDGGYRVSGSNEAIVFPNSQVPIGQRAGLVVEKHVYKQSTK